MEPIPTSVEGWLKRMEDSEKMEGEYFDRVSRKFKMMFEKVKAARTVPKLVQTALAEAMDAHRYAIEARKERLEAKSQWMKLRVGKEPDNGGVVNLDEGTEKGSVRLSEEIMEMKNLLIEQDRKISELTASDTNRLREIQPRENQMTKSETVTFVEEPWTIVPKKKPNRAIKKKAPAVIVKAGAISYVDVLKRVREEPTLKEWSDEIMSIRRTEAGHLLVELDRNSGNVEKINSAITKAVGETGSVITLGQTVKVGVFGLDEVTTSEEVEQAITLAFPNESVKNITMRKIPRGQQIAIITTTTEFANKIVDLGRIRVGYISSRTRMWLDIHRCYRCQAPGHETHNCQGTDRSNCCRGCGNHGHYIKDCQETVINRASFRETLRQEALRSSSQ